mmetsp:Transcript_51430/g.101936  ORF Transcript_51430/g.101936 Transcript_51430/m.101936 type:complete len:541 (-) Transcript_51430:194-1816(-)
MLDSVTWGLSDQLYWNKTNQVSPTNEEMRSSQSPSANSSEWRRRSSGAIGQQVPLFERLLDRVVLRAPTSVPVYAATPLRPPAVDWEGALDQACGPAAGGLDEQRAERKSQQVGNLLGACCALIDHLLDPRSSKSKGKFKGTVHVVEFCGGAGYVGLPLAAMYAHRQVESAHGGGLVPAVRVTILDMKEQSLDIARQRVVAAGLEKVVEVCRERLEDFERNHSENGDGGDGGDASGSEAPSSSLTPPSLSSFDVGIALHACGPATDLCQELCIKAQAAYVMSPCCVGKLRSSRKAGVTRRGGLTPHSSLLHAAKAEKQSSHAEKNEQPTDASEISYPRSKTFARVLSNAEWATIARAADFGHREYTDYSKPQRRRRLAKSFVEHDRQLRAEEAGYTTHTSVMVPRTCTPKNDVIAGWPQCWGVAFLPSLPQTTAAPTTMMTTPNAAAAAAAATNSPQPCRTSKEVRVVAVDEGGSGDGGGGKYPQLASPVILEGEAAGVGMEARGGQLGASNRAITLGLTTTKSLSALEDHLFEMAPSGT